MTRTTSTESRILIADDEPLFRQTTGELLRKAGYECVCVPDADTALTVLNRERFDLALVDLNMPGNLELELLRQGRTEFPTVPMIVVTGAPTLPSAIESVRLRIADYLLKPVRYEDLLNSVARALADSQTDMEPATEESALSAERDERWGGSRPARLMALKDAEWEYLTDLLSRHAGNVSRSAREAHMSRQGFYKLLAKHGIDPDRYRMG